MTSQPVKKKPLITPLARLSYANLFRARAVNEGDEKKFSCTLIFDLNSQKTPEYKALQKAAADAVKEKWGDKAPPKLRSPFRDASEKDGAEGYEDGYTFISCNSKQPPGVVSSQRDPETGKPMVITDENEIKSGDYVLASVRAYAYDTKGNKGVSFGLNGIQLRKVGDPLGNRTRAEDDFNSVESDEGDNDSSADDIFKK
jgi:hypothetical protein